MIPPEISAWSREAAPHFEKGGASRDTAQKFALLYALAWSKGLNPRITSLFRDPAYQLELQARWDRGDRAGLRERPATNSNHSKTGFGGVPAARAMDMTSNNDKAVESLAREIGLGSGATFSKPDPGHYYAP